MISFWWILLAFVLGGYAGAVLVGLMTLSAGEDRPVHGRGARNSRMEVARRRRHAPVDAHPAHSG